MIVRGKASRSRNAESARLRSLEVLPVQGAVARLAGAAAELAQRTGLLVRLRDDAGGYGQGEASPLPGYCRDTLEECAQQLVAVDIATLPAPGEMPAADWVGRALDVANIRAPAARFALETALLDWLGRARGASLAALLAERGTALRRVPLAALIADLAAARAAHARGVRCFKVKISAASFDADLALAQALRAEFGDAIALRFDANGRLDPSRAAAQLQALARVAPEFVEEPVAYEDLERVAGSPVALAADESLAQRGAWPALASICRVVVLKPTLLGGLLACLRIAREASLRGLAVTVTHTFDGPIALAAAAELAAVLPGRVLACGLDRHPALAVWPAVEIAQIQAAHAQSAGRPGLGMPLVSPR